jgi:glycosyltransferase involved in cell wall biosynthesis
MPHNIRVLSVDATALSSATDMGILKTHLFSAWPRDQLAQIIVGGMANDVSLCARNWRITRQDMERGQAGGEETVAPTQAGRTPKVVEGPIGRMRAALWRALQPIRYGVSDRQMSTFDARRHPELLDWVKEFRPDAVFTFGASATICRLATEISEVADVPIVPYFTDDWISWLYARPPLRMMMRPRLERWFARMLRRSPLGLTICDAMAAEYAERYGMKFSACWDSVDMSRYPFSAKQERAAEPVVFAFVGVLAPKRWKSLRVVAEAVERIRRKGVACKLRIYTMPADIEAYGDVLNLSDDVRIVGTLPYSEVPRAQLESDVLVHVEGFISGGALAKTRLSLSTKIPQYLAAGRPILALGPAHIASMDYLKSSGAAIVLDTFDASAVAGAVERLAVSASLRETMGMAGRALCEKRHVRSAMNACFQDAILRSVDSQAARAVDQVLNQSSAKPMAQEIQ